MTNYNTLINQLEATKVHRGDPEANENLWQQCDMVVTDENAPMEIRVRALVIVARIIGDVNLAVNVRPEAVDIYTQLLREKGEAP